MGKSILILGGTREAREIAERLSQSTSRRVITSLAGRTTNPALPHGEIRTGGFGGATGLAQYLDKEAIELLIDATHPFAETISRNARTACKTAGVHRVVFTRPQWRPMADDNWMSVPDTRQAARTLPPGSTVFLALGHQHLAPFTHRDDVRFVVRMVDKPTTPLKFSNHVLLVAKPSDSCKVEMNLFERHSVTRLVCRNSGGEGSFAKLVAARSLSLPVIMIDRPPPVSGENHDTVEALIAAIN